MWTVDTIQMKIILANSEWLLDLSTNKIPFISFTGLHLNVNVQPVLCLLVKHAFSNRFNYATSIKILFHAMGIKLTLYVFTDAKSIFDTITASKGLWELRLMNNISEIRRAYKENKIDDVAWIRSEPNIADDLTRLVGNSILLNTLRSGVLKFVIKQWVCKDDDYTSQNLNPKKEKE